MSPKLCITCKELVEQGTLEKATRANFGQSGGKLLFCKRHKGETDVSIEAERAKKCIVEECGTVASYGKRNSNVREYCVKHKPHNYVDKRKRICHGDNDTCMVHATYAQIGIKRAERCAKHKIDGDVDVVTFNICKYDDCYIQGVFGNKSQPKIRYCKHHKENDHIDISHPLCNHEHCPRRARFSMRGMTKPTKCSDHRDDEMVDIDSGRCKLQGCYIQPTFGEPGTKKPLFCINHKNDHHVDVRSRKCKHDDCGKQPVFGEVEGEPLFCKNHMLSHYKDVINPKCPSCKLFITIKKDKLCSYCNPESTVRQKTRESVVKEFLEENVDIPFKHDVTIEDGKWCGKYRPDFLYDCGTHFIVVECDEDQHKGYDQSCEVIRMKNIVHSLGMRTVFLRYNPDVYREDDVVKRISKDKRLKELSERVKYYSQTKFKNMMLVEWLYYNDKHLERKALKIDL